MKLLFISLGCDKNLVDSEVMLGELHRRGYSFTEDETEAEIIVINTCCFINDAKEESIQTILEMADYKHTGSCKALIVTGCLAQRYRQEIIDEIPQVDAVLGTTSFDHLCEAIDEALKGQQLTRFDDLEKLVKSENHRILTTGGHYAHLKIAEGCDKHCTYCIIPKIRGTYRSVPMEELVEEAEYLVSRGVKELILVAQETTLYGLDLYGEKSLHQLLEKLCKIPGLYWIRLQYCYPEEIYEELIRTIAKEEKICHYLDLPIQHCNDRLLKRMGRRTNKQQLMEKIRQLRAAIPDIALRTTLIAGFPGETPQDHEEMMQFVNDMEFDRLGCFAYSPEEDTPAATYEDQVAEELKEQWRDEIMELQSEVCADLAEEMIGKELFVMVEGKVADEPAYIGRTYKDAPGVDGYIFIRTGEVLLSGDFVKVRITGAIDYDLIGEIADADEFTE